MKKLMIALAVAATSLFSSAIYGADVTQLSGTSFEDLATGDKTVADIVNKDDAGDTVGTLYWFSTADDMEALGVVTNEAPYTGTMRPEAYTNAVNANYLTLDTSTPLYRTINGTASSIGDFEGTEIGDGLYLDTLVKFTAADSTNDLQLAEGDKIAISYVVEDMDDDGDGVYLTNFVVRAGYVNGSVIDQKNYVMDAINDFNSTNWHRLTVRAISNVGSSTAPVGFVVYVDGTNLTYSTDVAAGDSDYVGSLNAAVVQNLYNSEKHALLPSAIDANATTYNTLSAVAFKGNGSIDDISFTPNTPSFISDSEKKTVAFTIPAGVTSLTIDGVDYYDVEGVATTNIAFAANDADFSLVIGCAQDYTVSAVEVTGCSYSVADGTYTVTFSAASATFAISTTRGNFAYVVGGETLKAATLAAALSAADADSTITLMYDYDVSDWESLSEASPVYTISKNVTLDLNGKVLDGGSSDYRFMFSTTPNCTLTVIDSNNEGTGTITYGGTYGIFGGDGDVIIGSNDAGVTDYGPIINGSAIGISEGWITSVYRGKFTYAENTTEGGEFTCDSADGVEAVDWEVSSVAKDSEESPEYWVVTVNGAATTYELTIPEVTGATATVTDADEQEISDLTAIAEGTVVTVTWAPSTGYKITAGETEEITMDADKTAKSPTVVAIKYATLTITQVENCTIVVSNATEEVASGAQFDVDDATQLTVYRTPANGYKLSNGCAATETITMNDNVTVTAVVEEESEYPSYIDDNVAYKDAYDQWKTENSVAAGDNQYVDAFLLNIAPDAADQTLEPASITMEGGKVVISANQTLTAVNGKVYVKVATTLAGLASAEWTEVTLNEGKVQVTPGSSDTAGFYKIKVDF